MRKTDLTPARTPPGVTGKLGESEDKRESTPNILCATFVDVNTPRRFPFPEHMLLLTLSVYTRSFCSHCSL